MKAIGWFVVAAAMFVWACGARGFADELAAFLRGGPPEGGGPGPPDDQVDQLGGADPGGGGH